MPATNPPRCRHLHTDGRQCGSPALRHEKLCYQHHSARLRPAYTPTLPDPEDLHAVQRGLAELLRLVARELIEDKQAKRLFAILDAAGTNLARLHRQQAQARELDLRERALALAHSRARFQAQHLQEAGCPTTETGFPTFATIPSSRRWASTEPEPPVTDPVQDPELGLIAPHPELEPRSKPEAHEPEHPTEPTFPIQDTGAPSFAASS